MRLKDKVAIVTGGGKGIGKDIALAFAAEGAKVVVAARTLAKLEESEVAAVAVFLASDESSIITGQTITSHCGQHIVN